jgi:DNA (cytosine-5)-methyltransferase 1
MANRDPVSVIDLFAGPGGLGEGFTSLEASDNRSCFKVRLSIERDAHAHQTLLLRALYRQFSPGRVPGLYYDVLRGTADVWALFKRFPEHADKATKEAWHAELGVTNYTEVRARIRTALNGSENWVLIGGPPCQAYSVAGRSRNKGVDGYEPDKDERQYLYAEYLGIIADHWPAIFVMENVKGLLSATVLERRMFELIRDDLSNPAKAVKSRSNARSHTYTILSVAHRDEPLDGVGVGGFVVQAERFGIPQARHRVILLGVRNDLGRIENLPKISLRVSEEVPAKKVLDRLPAVRSGLSHGEDGNRAWLDAIKDARERRWVKATKALAGVDVHDLIIDTIDNLELPKHGRGSEFIPGDYKAGYEQDWFHDGKLEGICNHVTKEHMPLDLHRYLYAACYARRLGTSPRLRHFPADLLPEHKNVEKALNGHGYFADRFRVQVAGRPSTTITSHLAKDGHGFIHPDPRQCRSLTAREAARLQTFPDNYLFRGPRTAQCIQVGNAVPPLLARGIAKIVWSILKKSGLAD